MSETIGDLERRIGEARTAGRNEELIAGVLKLATIIAESREGAAAAALFPYVLMGCVGSGEALSYAEELKHAIMHYDPSDRQDRLTDHFTVEPSSPAFVAVKLLEGGVLSAGEYILLVEKFGQVFLARRDGEVVSVLHLLRERSPSLLERALLFMSTDANTALLPLARFWPQAEVFRGLPAEYALTRGAFAFDRIEDSLLVALLNPYDVKLREEIQWQQDLKCIFYLVAPEDYDAALLLLRESTGT